MRNRYDYLNQKSATHPRGMNGEIALLQGFYKGSTLSPIHPVKGIPQE